jgi:hypothetical protein
VLEKYPHWTEQIVRDEALKFSNHWHAATGKTASKLDWYGTWQNWCMSDICQRAHPVPTAAAIPPTPESPIAAILWTPDLTPSSGVTHLGLVTYPSP